MPAPRKKTVTIEPVGDRCLLLRLGEESDPATPTRVQALAAQLRAQPIEGVRDIIPALTTLALHYRPECFAPRPYETLHALLLKRLAQPLPDWSGSGREIEIPVCYGATDKAFGPDLEAVAAHCQLTPDEVIARHVASPHRVQLLGFAPGFPFIGGLDAMLEMPRLPQPRTRIPPGSVAIARRQTCIYPLETPGGWNLIGRMPLRLFNPAAEPPCLLMPGDAIRFVPIDAARYRELLEQQEQAA